MNNALDVWEDEGGAATSATLFVDHPMIGTLNQIAWAVQIKSRVNTEFDRVRQVLEHAMAKQPPADAADIDAILRILEDKRALVMENERAGYFIHDWQELGNRVSRMIVEDPRYQAIKASQAARLGSLEKKAQ